MTEATPRATARPRAWTSVLERRRRRAARRLVWTRLDHAGAPEAHGSRPSPWSDGRLRNRSAARRHLSHGDALAGRTGISDTSGATSKSIDERAARLDQRAGAGLPAGEAGVRRTKACAALRLHRRSYALEPAREAGREYIGASSSTANEADRARARGHGLPRGLGQGAGSARRPGQQQVDAHLNHSATIGYEIRLSARCSTAGGIVSPSAFAVFRLITSSNFVGCSTGRSAGLAPFRILSTYTAERPMKSVMFTLVGHPAARPVQISRRRLIVGTRPFIAVSFVICARFTRNVVSWQPATPPHVPVSWRRKPSNSSGPCASTR